MNNKKITTVLTLLFLLGSAVAVGSDIDLSNVKSETDEDLTIEYLDLSMVISEIDEARENIFHIESINQDPLAGYSYYGEKDAKGRPNGQGGLINELGSKKNMGLWKNGVFYGTSANWEKEQVRRAKKEKYDRIYNACLLDKSASVDMQVHEIYGAVRKTCISIAKNPSWFESMKYD